MTQKLKILGPYTPEHEGPFCTRDGGPVRIITHTDGSEKLPIIGFLCGLNSPSVWDTKGNFYGSEKEHGKDLMNAEEVPQPREFWMAFSTSGGRITCRSPEEAHQAFAPEYRKEVIHVREVLPGEGE